MSQIVRHEACGVIASQSGMEPTSPALEGEVVATGPPREVPVFISWSCLSCYGVLMMLIINIMNSES